jgi:tyrosyl-tRNA synthetase
VPFYFNVLTDVEDEYVSEVAEKVKNGNTITGDRRRLAENIVSQLYDAEALIKAKEDFDREVEGSASGYIRTISINECNASLLAVLKGTGLITSINDGRRLIREGAIEVNGVKERNSNAQLHPDTVERGSIIRVGKRGILRLD